MTTALQRIARPFEFHGYTYRIIDDEFRTDPLSGIGSVVKRGRYNAPGIFEALYSSDSRITALYEMTVAPDSRRAAGVVAFEIVGGAKRRRYDTGDGGATLA